MAVLTYFGGLAVLLLLLSLNQKSGRMAASVDRLDRNLERLSQLLAIRLPSPEREELTRLQTLLAENAYTDDLMEGRKFTRPPGAHPHPLVKLVDDCVTRAYESAGEVTLNFGPVEKMSPEKQEEFLDYFWHRFDRNLRSSIASAGVLTESDEKESDDSTPREPGPPKLKVGDVLIRRYPAISDDGLGLAKPWKVESIADEGRQDRGHFFTEGGAQRRALRLAGTWEKIVIAPGDGTWYRAGSSLKT